MGVRVQKVSSKIESKERSGDPYPDVSVLAATVCLSMAVKVLVYIAF